MSKVKVTGAQKCKTYFMSIEFALGKHGISTPRIANSVQALTELFKKETDIPVSHDNDYSLLEFHDFSMSFQA